ncbi:MAG: lipoprotein B transmembrane [Gammaproteobacteria bacterium]|nr:lipoprotein B transmembrane [Gammaproteobacteria bacterium]NNJ85137.1 lipoprotein B transmembrane [Gammaproteobacteria bacterium]
MQNANKTTFLLSLIISFALLTGCGFHLRGNISLPDEISSLQVRGPMQLADELLILLESSEVVTTSDSPNAILMIERETFDKQTLSVDSNTGKEREHALAYTVFYRVVAADGKELLPKQTVNLLRDYVFDEEAVLATSREQDVLHQEMRREAANQILRRLVAWRP